MADVTPAVAEQKVTMDPADYIDLTDPSPNSLILANMPLVDHIVRALASGFPSHVDRDDLRAAGRAGLVDAAHRYDPNLGVPFDRYAKIRIRGAVLDETRQRDWATRRTRQELRRIDEATSRLVDRHGQAPDVAEVAAEAGMTVDAVEKREADRTVSSLLTLDRPAKDLSDDAGTLGENLTSEECGWQPETVFETNELAVTLRRAIGNLPEQLRDVLIDYYFGGRQLTDIGEALQVTEARVSQLVHEAVHALQAYFSTQYDWVVGPADEPGKRRRAAYLAQMAEQDADRAQRRMPTVAI